jgi:hypothetical protein
MIDDMLGGEQQAASSKPMLQDYKNFKHGKEAEIQYRLRYFTTSGEEKRVS